VATIQSIADCPLLPVVEGVEIRHVPNCAGFAAGDDGSVWSCRPLFGKGTPKWKRLSPHYEQGYRIISLSAEALGIVGRKQVPTKVAIVICTTFHGPKPIGHEVLHRDGTRDNDAASNLHWGTRQENVQDSFRHGTAFVPEARRGEAHPLSVFTESSVREIRQSDLSQRQLAKKYGVSRGAIQGVLSRRNWSHV